MTDKPENSELADTEHQNTWSFFMSLTQWASLGTLWIVGMLVAVLGLNLPVLPPLIVLTLLVAAVAHLLRIAALWVIGLLVAALMVLGGVVHLLS